MKFSFFSAEKILCMMHGQVFVMVSVSKNSQDTKRSSNCSLNKCDICRHDRIKANRHNPTGLGN